MNIKVIFILTFFILFSISCNEVKEKSDAEANVKKEELEDLTDYVKDEPIFIFNKKEFNKKCEFEINHDSSIIGVNHLFVEKDTVSFSSDKELTWRPFGLTVGSVVNSNKIMKWLGNIESIDTLQLLDDKIYDKKITVISRKSKIEFLVAKGFKRVNYAVFEDKDLTFASGIKIGMAKMEFAKKIDPNYDSCILKYNFYKNYDPPGVSVDQTFIFKNEVLIKIIFKTPR